MIRDLIVPAVQEAFPHKLFVVSSPPEPVLKLGSGCTDIGDLAIYDDGQEATVSITEITHGHFHPNDESLTQDQIDANVRRTLFVSSTRSFPTTFCSTGHLHGTWAVG